MRALGARACEVMGTPLDAGFLTPPLSPPSCIETVCFAGRLAAEKNIDAVLNAVHDWPDLGFVIAGEGPAGSFSDQGLLDSGSLVVG